MVEQAVERARRDENACCTVFFLNLDRFKFINDTLGPVAGDRVLLAVADRLRRCLSPGDVLARLGGDEFGVLCSEFEDSETA
jgi:diguanylate cyclase (GGDEF)-like protein